MNAIELGAIVFGAIKFWQIESLGIEVKPGELLVASLAKLQLILAYAAIGALIGYLAGLV